MWVEIVCCCGNAIGEKKNVFHFLLLELLRRIISDEFQIKSFIKQNKVMRTHIKKNENDFKKINFSIHLSTLNIQSAVVRCLSRSFTTKQMKSGVNLINIH